MERISWDDYFMVMAFWVSRRSPDESTKCGCVLVNKNNQIVGLGYNGYPRKVDETKMPKTRPEKYPPILHSEENAILNCSSNLEGATAYITGPPCTHCWAHIIQKGIKRVVYGPITTSKNGIYADIRTDSFPDVVCNMLDGQNIEIVRWDSNNKKFLSDEIDLVKNFLGNY